ncbi:MAG TPA: hypothetical protein VI072_28285 [Polyangiaceae bacterium]
MPHAFGRNPFTTFGLPPDIVAWCACVTALLALAANRRIALWAAQLGPREARRVALLLGVSAALLSAGYIAFYLRGGPRIIDATSYFLEARVLSQGRFSFDVPWPSASFRGRFLTSPPDASALSVIFPPGWPALLALGFKLGAPLAIGPALAFAIVLSTYALAKRLFDRQDVALAAATLSALCAALRYHTADTMAHGLCALLLCTVLYAALRDTLAWTLLAGLGCGWLLATRPVSGAVAALIAGLLIMRRPRDRWRGASVLAVGALPGLLLLAIHQYSATGSWFGSAQYHYYALADGPPGCFRYGFGAGIGCLHEHAEAVAKVLPDGYGWSAAALTTSHRVLLNLIDIGNAEPIALLVPVALVLGRRHQGVRLLLLSVALLVLAYAPFYFPGNYPGGGARFLADVLPLEHALVAWAAVRVRCARFLAPVALAGFAFHTSYAHRALADREGGHPMFEARALEQAHVERGIVFVQTDHGFNLGHVPGANPKHGVVVARARRDAHDALLWERLGRPPSYLYAYDPFARAAAGRLLPYRPEPNPVLRFEGESAWPPLDVRGGWAHPSYSQVSCASGGRGLRLRSINDSAVVVALELAAPRAGDYLLTTAWSGYDERIQRITLEVSGQRSAQRLPVSPDPCWKSEPWRVRLWAGPQRLQTALEGGGALLDYVELAPAN